MYVELFFLFFLFFFFLILFSPHFTVMATSNRYTDLIENIKNMNQIFYFVFFYLYVGRFRCLTKKCMEWMSRGSATISMATVVRNISLLCPILFLHLTYL